MEGEVFQKVRAGTPQGGVISPLLANVALHGLEYETQKALGDELFNYLKISRGMAGKERSRMMLRIIRYSDDFVIIHESLEIIRMAKEFVQQ
jgi:RNA-directed DNA polymerase